MRAEMALSNRNKPDGLACGQPLPWNLTNLHTCTSIKVHWFVEKETPRKHTKISALSAVAEVAVNATTPDSARLEAMREVLLINA